MSFISVSSNQWYQDFSTFLKDSQIFNLAIGFLIAQATMDTSKSFVGSIIMPVIDGIRKLKAPQLAITNLVGSFITFFVTLLIAFIFIKVFRLQAKPIQPVIIANSDARIV